jgi:hypothetical protein
MIPILACLSLVVVDDIPYQYQYPSEYVVSCEYDNIIDLADKISLCVSEQNFESGLTHLFELINLIKKQNSFVNQVDSVRLLKEELAQWGISYSKKHYVAMKKALDGKRNATAMTDKFCFAALLYCAGDMIHYVPMIPLFYVGTNLKDEAIKVMR